MTDAGKLVVARYRDGRTVAGKLDELRVERKTFRVEVGEGIRTEVDLRDLKALFFVKSIQGDPEHVEDKRFPEHNAGGIKTWVEFEDGEELSGWQTRENPLDDGIFLFPTDVDSNVEKAYLPRGAVKRILVDDEAMEAAERYRNRRPEATMTPEQWELLLDF